MSFLILSFFKRAVNLLTSAWGILSKHVALPAATDGREPSPPPSLLLGGPQRVVQPRLSRHTGLVMRLWVWEMLRRAGESQPTQVELVLLVLRTDPRGFQVSREVS